MIYRNETHKIMDTYPIVRRFVLSLWLCFSAINLAAGQVVLRLHFSGEVVQDSQQDTVLEFANEGSMQAYLSGSIREWHDKNYLAAALDSMACQDKTCDAWLNIGSKITRLRLNNGNIPVDWWQSVRSPQQIEGVSDAALTEIKTRFLAYAEQRGYPFARVWLDSIAHVGSVWSVSVMLDAGPKYTFGAIKIQGSARISASYVSLYTGLRSGETYNYALLQAAEKRLRELPFLTQQYAPRILFNGDKADITFFLMPKNASRFDALLGLQPNNSPTAATKFVVTGTLSADVINALGYGERVLVDFRQLRPQTQQLRTELTWPYPFRQPLGLDGKFALYKQDTTYLDVSWEAGIRVLAPGMNYVRLFYQYFGTSLLEVNTNQIILTRKLPPQLDSRRWSGGVEVQWQRLDFRFNPRKGWSVWAQVIGGLREIKTNATIAKLLDNGAPDFDFATLYEGKLGQTWQFRTENRIENYFRMANSTVRLAVQSGMVGNKNSYLKNDLFRIGGYKILRGFDEESQYVSVYGISTLEYRLIIGEYGYLNVFGDYGWVQQGGDTPIWQQKIGIGSGIAVETRAGILNFMLAVGKDGSQPFDFRSLKTHIGYVSVF